MSPRPRISVGLPQLLHGDEADVLRRYAVRAEELGFAGLWSLDAVPGSATARVPLLDGLHALTTAAAVTGAIGLGIAQPHVSKHLRVLREVDAVLVRDAGRQRLYRVNGQALRPIHDWVAGFERMWSERFDALDDVLDDLVKGERDDAHPPR